MDLEYSDSHFIQLIDDHALRETFKHQQLFPKNEALKMARSSGENGKVTCFLGHRWLNILKYHTYFKYSKAATFSTLSSGVTTAPATPAMQAP